MPFFIRKNITFPIKNFVENKRFIQKNLIIKFLNSNKSFLSFQLPPSCTWQTLRDIFRDIGEVKFAEIRGQDSGVVRFSKERDAELAISMYNL